MTAPAEMLAAAPLANGVVSLASDVAWAERLRQDRQRAGHNQSAELAAVSARVEARCREVDAKGLVLTGSTARGRRTRVSDLDYHVIGARPDVDDATEEIDIYSDEPPEFLAKLRKGDDFAHWSVRYGCVLFDSGPVREGADLIAKLGLWPDPDRKLRQARQTLGFAKQILATGDYGAALEQTRGALSLTARWCLLTHGTFPLARAELSPQLRASGLDDLAEALDRSIYGQPPEVALREALAMADAVVSG